MAVPAYFRHVQALPDCRYRQANGRARQAGPRRQATRALPGHRLIVKYLPTIHGQKGPAPSADPHCPWRWQAANIVQGALRNAIRSEEHTSELQSLMRISYAVFCLKK